MRYDRCKVGKSSGHHRRRRFDLRGYGRGCSNPGGGTSSNKCSEEYSEIEKEKMPKTSRKLISITANTGRLTQTAAMDMKFYRICIVNTRAILRRNLPSPSPTNPKIRLLLTLANSE